MITLLTANSRAYQPLADLGNPGREEYCKRWGLHFMPRIHELPFVCWDRPRMWLDELERCQWLLFMGTDTLITNHTVNIRDFMEDDVDFVFSADGNGLQSDVWLMRSNGDTRQFMREVLWQEKRGCSNEQDAMSIVLSRSRDYSHFCSKVGPLKQGGEPPSLETLQRLCEELSNTSVRIKIVEQRAINAYPHAHYGGSDEMPHSWNPGDFLLHMPGKSLEYRLQHWRHYLDQVIR